MIMGEKYDLPTAAQVLREAYVLASRPDIGDPDTWRAGMLFDIAKELREGSTPPPAIVVGEDVDPGTVEVFRNLKADAERWRERASSAQAEAAHWKGAYEALAKQLAQSRVQEPSREPLADYGTTMGGTPAYGAEVEERVARLREAYDKALDELRVAAYIPVSVPLFDAAATQTQIPVPALRPHEGECPACGTAVYEAQTSDGKEARHRITGTIQCPDYGREA
jgi:hypothetical protein